MNVKNARRVFVLLGLVMALAMAFSACVNTDDVPEIEGGQFEENSEVIVDDDNKEISTPEGHSNAPKNITAVNIEPDTIAICGNCDEGAVITVKGGEEEVTVKSRNGYFIAETKLPYEKNQIEVTATVGDLKESLPYTFVASYNATAEDRIDGNSVSVGKDSRLYFSKMLDDLSGANIYTESNLASIRKYVGNTLSTYYESAKAHKAELIYVLIPNVTTVYNDAETGTNEIIPDGMYETPFTTIYDQVYDTLENGTRATVIDMRETFLANKDGEKALYRVTDSSLSDYGAYLTYKAIMDKVAERFPAAAPHGEEEFEWSTVSTIGGNLVGYRELDKKVIKEDILIATPKFNMDIGDETLKLSSIRKYIDTEDNDYGYYTTVSSDDEINGLAERLVIDGSKGREEGMDASALPNALVYRDYSSLAFSDILAERFNRSLFVAAGEYSINLNYATQNAAEGKSAVDYIIVIISEDSMDEAFDLAIAQ